MVLVLQFYGCFALQVFEPVTWLKTTNTCNDMSEKSVFQPFWLMSSETILKKSSEFSSEGTAQAESLALSLSDSC